MVSLKTLGIRLVPLFLIVADISSQPPSFNPFHYIYLPRHVCSLPCVVYLETAHSNCSGTIIHERWVLTAARCLYSDDETRVRNDGVKVLAGASDYTKSRVQTAQERYSVQIITHNRYKFNTISKFDFALIKVNAPFDLTNCVDKVTIAAKPWPDYGNRSKKCLSWGFGAIGPNVPNTRLKIWNSVASHGHEACPCANRFQAKRLICSAEAVGVNLCRGDLGSSLLCYEGENPLSYWNLTQFIQSLVPRKNNFSVGHQEIGMNMSRLTLYGVAHMTIDKYRCDITRVPKKGCVRLPTYSAYMYLCPFNSWLRRHVPELPETIDKCGLPSRISLGKALLAVFTLVLLVLYL